ncbi:MAG: MFS transporter [Bacteroidia bacterium]|nr:MFS transporter [Bacteroidia bacterium]
MIKKTFFPVRFILLFFTFLLTVLLYVDRACISTAKVPISKDLNFGPTDFGWIMAIFTLGYALFQFPSGKLADNKGPKSVLAGIVTIWSLLTSLTGATWNYASMLIIRFLFGAGEAGAFPSLAKVVYSWFPMSERGIVQGINFSGSRLGAAFAMPLVACMLSLIGWRNTFVFFGIIGIVFALLWYFLFTNTPEESKLLNQSEKEFIIRNRQKSGRSEPKKLTFSNILRSGNVWLAMIQYTCSNFTFYFTLTWMYPYLQERFMLDGVKTGFYAMIPLIFGAAGNWISGIMVDFIYKKGKPKLSRQLPAIIGFLLAASGILLLSVVKSPEASIFALSVAIFGADMTISPSWAFCIDIGKENSGVVSGTMNMAGNLGAFVTIIAFPYIFKWTGGHETFFYLCSGLSLMATVIWLFMKPEKAVVGE